MALSSICFQNAFITYLPNEFGSTCCWCWNRKLSASKNSYSLDGAEKITVSIDYIYILYYTLISTSIKPIISLTCTFFSASITLLHAYRKLNSHTFKWFHHFVELLSETKRSPTPLLSVFCLPS